MPQVQLPIFPAGVTHWRFETVLALKTCKKASARLLNPLGFALGQVLFFKARASRNANAATIASGTYEIAVNESIQELRVSSRAMLRHEPPSERVPKIGKFSQVIDAIGSRIVSKFSRINPYIENCRCRRHPCAIESEKHIPARQQNRGIAWKNRCQLITGLLESQIEEALIGIITVRRRTLSEECEG